MKKFLIIIVALATSACATIQNPVNTTRLAAVESAYGVALSIAVGYRNTRLCKKGEDATPLNICSKREVILKLQAADRNAQVALQAARNFVRNNPQLDAFSIIQSAESAVEVFQQIETSYGVR